MVIYDYEAVISVLLIYNNERLLIVKREKYNWISGVMDNILLIET